MEGLADLTEKRRLHVKSCKENGDNSHKIITDLYSDKSHFIYELLQNADDAKASEVIFDLSTEALEFRHNGNKLFCFRDVESITTVGSSTKKDDVNQIGKFGAGFKSVFAITKTPAIYSGEYSFRIVDFIVPEAITSNGMDGSTVIRLPFNHHSLTKEEAYQEISQGLKSLTAESLLFLKYIKKMQWHTESDKGCDLSEIKEDTARLTATVNEEESHRDYLLFRKPITIEKHELSVSVAYEINADNTSVSPADNSKLFVFFPTKESTGLNFLVHAPYKTTPNRETIPLEDDQNQAITSVLSELIAESIQLVKDKGLLDVSFLSLLPMDDSENKHPVYRSAFQRVKDMLMTKPLLPTSGQGYEKASDALLAREKGLTDLLDGSDCSRLFQKKAWLNTEITHDKTEELRDYLMKILDIPEIDLKKFCEKLTDDFLKTKPDEWIIKFYAKLSANEALSREGSNGKPKGILRERPIIRLENNTHICPENDSGILQVYLPAPGTSRVKTVKKTIAENEQALEFLKNLRLEKPDCIAEIREHILPKYEKDDGEIKQDEYLEDFGDVAKTWLRSDKYDREKVVDMIKKVKFIGSVDYRRDFSLHKPAEVYAPEEKLWIWFKGNREDDVYFLADCLQESDEKCKEFLEALPICTEPYTCGKEQYGPSWRGEYYVKGLVGFNPKFDIKGLEYSLNALDIDRSFYMFELALKHVRRLAGSVHESSRRSFEGGKHNLILKELSVAGRLLTDKYWLYDKNRHLIEKPLHEISIEDLCDGYNKEDENIDKLIKALGLKPDEIREFEKKTGWKVLPASENAEYEKWKADKSRGKEQTQEDRWIPEIDPNDAPITVDPLDNRQREQRDLSGQNAVESSKDGNVDDAGAEEDRGVGNPNKSKNVKEIGRWGEEYARKYLIEKYQNVPGKEVIWLNENRGVGTGYDFVIRENGEDIAYYEVKSTTDETPQLFEISGTQWGWAKYLYNQNWGEMYKILLVSNAGKPEVKIKEIKNPVARWKEGNIYADPVKIEL